MALLVTAGFIMAAANSTKDATALFDPVVLAAVSLAVWRRGQGAAWLTALLAMLGSWIALAGLAIAVGGGDYWQGITVSTLARPQAAASAGPDHGTLGHDHRGATRGAGGARGGRRAARHHPRAPRRYGEPAGAAA